MNTLIGIVIPVRNCLELTKATVGSIKTSHPYHLYYIDDHSGAETKAWLSRQENATVFTDPKHSTGLAWNWNLGIAAAINDGASYILVANNDILLHPDAIDTMLSRLDTGDVVLVSGNPDVYQPPEEVLVLKVDSKGENPDAELCCFMITPETIKKVGWFDENYRGAYCEDTDYKATIYHYGETAICLLAAPLHHYVSSTIKQDKEHDKYTTTACRPATR